MDEIFCMLGDKFVVIIELYISVLILNNGKYIFIKVFCYFLIEWWNVYLSGFVCGKKVNVSVNV